MAPSRATPTNPVLPVIDTIDAMLARAVDWAPGRPLPAPGSTVCVVGPARSGAPGGALSAPLSQRPCVWFQAVDKDNHLQNRISAGLRLPPEAFQAPAYVPGTLFPVGPGVGAGGLVPVHTTPPGVRRSTDPILLEVAGSTIAVSAPRDALVDCTEASVNYLSHDAAGNDEALYQEWLVEPAQRLRCYGALQLVDGVPTLVPDASGTIFFSTGSLERVRSFSAGRPTVERMRRIQRNVVIGAVLLAIAVVVALVLILALALH